MRIWAEKIHLKLKVNWKLSRNQTTFKENFILYLQDGDQLFTSEVAPNIRYGETPDKIYDQFLNWVEQNDLSKIKTVEELNLLLDTGQMFHSLRFGIESVFLSLFAYRNSQSLSQYLHLSDIVAVETSFSMPILEIGEIRDYLAPLKRFKSLKIKVNSQSARDMLEEVSRYSQAKLRVDANEGWTDLDEFMRFHECLKKMNVEFIEQPFVSTMHDEYRELKKMTPYQLIADESIEDVGDFSQLSSEFHGVNIKLMKTGSLIKARDLILKAKAHQMSAMIGCMIETSIGISYGMLFGGMVDYVDLDGFLLIDNEPFRKVIENDGILNVCALPSRGERECI